VLVAVAAGGWLLDRVPGRSAEATRPDTAPAPARSVDIDSVDARFEQGVVMLHLQRFEYALAAFDRVVELEPGLVEAHVNRGFALLGLEQFAAACAAFEQALSLRPMQTNAYYGLAVGLEGLGDLAGALGAMRTYLHLSPASAPEDEYQRRAAAAVWEWEAVLAERDRPQAGGEAGS
jgi:tetratricopeptide (TPR) repeat protein